MTLVLDASVLAEYLVASRIGEQAAPVLSEHAGDLHVPHLAVVETVSVLRAWVWRGELAPQRVAAAISDLRDLPARRWPAEPFLDRVWELRANLTAYDAAYVALAEILDATLLTADVRLARSGVAACPVQLVGPGEDG